LLSQPLWEIMIESTLETEWRSVFREPASNPTRLRVRDAMVTGHLPLVRTLARRYIGRGEPFADLVQVGSLGLIKAVDRFNPTLGTPFLRFATPTIIGEIKRHFRDHSWLVRVPRDLQELSALIRTTTEEMYQQSGQPPTPHVIAAHLGLGIDQVVVGMDINLVHHGLTLDGHDRADELAHSWMQHVEDRLLVRELLAHLPEQERVVIVLRFFGGWSQQRIATYLQCSQMHVSRLQERALTALRVRLECSGDTWGECDDDAKDCERDQDNADSSLNPARCLSQRPPHDERDELRHEEGGPRPTDSAKPRITHRE
jgi:RNA polymerase sigma-B factor